MHAIASQPLWIDTRPGRIFATRWRHATNPRSDDVPIVLLHDSLGCVALWRDFPEHLAWATGRNVIAYDRLGFGRSAPHPAVLDRHFIRDEASGTFSALLEAMDMERFIVFGHSVGGGMAVVCAEAYPDRCLALITESAQAFVEDRNLQGILAAKRAFAETGQVDRLSKYHGDKAAWVLDA